MEPRRRPTSAQPGTATLDDEHRLLAFNAELAGLVEDFRGEPPRCDESYLELVGPRYAPVQHAALSRARQLGAARSMCNGWGKDHHNYDVAITFDAATSRFELVFVPIHAGTALDPDGHFRGALAQNVTEMVLVFDEGRRLRAANAAYASGARAVTGHALEVGDDIMETLTPASRVAYDALCVRALTGEAFTEDIDLFLTVGARVTMEVAMNPLRDDAGDVTGVLVLSRNVTQRREDARVAKKAAELRRSIIAALPDAIAIVQRSGSILDVKPARGSTGHYGPSMVGRKLHDLVHLPAERILVALEAAFVTGEAQRVEYDAVVDGVVRSRDAWLHRISADEALWVVRDVTADKAAARQLALNDRMASLGALAAGVAHELNNPLQYVLANIELVASQLADTRGSTPEALAMLAEAREGVERASNIVAGLRLFSRADDGEGETGDVGRALGAAIGLARRTIATRATLDAQITASGRVAGSEARLAQVFLNILTTAAHTLDPAKLARNKVTIRVSELPGNQLAIEIEDNGHGIAPSVRARMFDPFFATAPAGDGTGLGLAIALQSVRAAGGDIQVEVTEGVGTLFRVLLPIAGTSSPVEPLAPSPPPKGPERVSPARILIIDDDASIRSSVKRLLSKNDVTVAENAENALEILERQTFDVVFCDVTMPGMSGIELIVHVASRWPGREADFVLMTGSLLSDAQLDALGEPAPPILQKPFTRQILLDRLAESLAARR